MSSKRLTHSRAVADPSPENLASARSHLGAGFGKLARKYRDQIKISFADVSSSKEEDEDQ